MSKDAFGDRMKLYEKVETSRRFMPLLPVCARLDGRSFSKFTRGLEKPYDKRLSDLMVSTTMYLVQETGACMGYTESDEISLCWYSDDIKSQIYFDGKIQKMVSTLAAECSAYFSLAKRVYLPEKKTSVSTFDCRVWQMPNLSEASNVFLWRELDATKNSIQTAAHSYYSHSELLHKHTGEMQDMLFQKGVNWNDYPPFFKRGTFVQRKKKIVKFSVEELEKLPAKHAARLNPDLEIERSVIEEIDMPPFVKVINRPGVIFNGQEPKTEQP